MVPDISDEIARASAGLARIAREASIALPGGVAGLPLVPCPAPTPPPYGTRSGAWRDAESFVREWASEGKDWVNIGLRVARNGEPYLCYEVPDRGTPDPPLEGEFGPSLDLNGPVFDRGSGHYSRGRLAGIPDGE